MLTALITPTGVAADPGSEPDTYVFERTFSAGMEYGTVTAYRDDETMWVYQTKEYPEKTAYADSKLFQTAGLGVTSAGFLLMTGDGVVCLDKETGAQTGLAPYPMDVRQWYIDKDENLYLCNYYGQLMELNVDGERIKDSEVSIYQNAYYMGIPDQKHFRIQFQDYNKPNVVDVDVNTFAVTEDFDYYMSPPLYEDVTDRDAWYYYAVTNVYVLGCMSGMSETLFGPAEKLSCAQFATILYRLESSLRHRAPSTGAGNPFPDVPDEGWYTDPALWANYKGIVTGYANGNFGPADNITREQIVTILYRFAKYHGCDVSATADLDAYPDAASVSDWAVDAMKWGVANKIISGKGGVYLDPTGTATRAECAQFITNFESGVNYSDLEKTGERIFEADA